MTQAFARMIQFQPTHTGQIHFERPITELEHHLPADAKRIFIAHLIQDMDIHILEHLGHGRHHFLDAAHTLDGLYRIFENRFPSIKLIHQTVGFLGIRQIIKYRQHFRSNRIHRNILSELLKRR